MGSGIHMSAFSNCVKLDGGLDIIARMLGCLLLVVVESHCFRSGGL